MNRGLLFVAWAVGTGIISWRSVKDCQMPPMPGQLLATSGAFVLLALLGEAGSAGATMANLLAVGIDIAAFMSLFPGSQVSCTNTAQNVENSKGGTVTSNPKVRAT